MSKKSHTTAKCYHLFICTSVFPKEYMNRRILAGQPAKNFQVGSFKESGAGQ